MSDLRYRNWDPELYNLIRFIKNITQDTASPQRFRRKKKTPQNQQHQISLFLRPRKILEETFCKSFRKRNKGDEIGGNSKKQNAIIFTFSEAYKFGDEVTTIETKKKERKLYYAFLKKMNKKIL